MTPIKSVNKLGIKGSFLNLINDIYEKPTLKKDQMLFFKDWEKANLLLSLLFNSEMEIWSKK